MVRKPLLLVIPLFSVAVIGLLLFVPAGRVDLPFFWVYVGIFLVVMLVGFLGIDRELLRERVKPGPGGRDFVMIYAGKALFTVHHMIAGLDVGRHHWSDIVPLAVQYVAMAAFAAGMSLALWAMIVNRFFSSVIRLQTDRDHHLITAGPYAWVRHPGYTGIILATLASGPALGSWVSALPLLGFVLLTFRRTWIEDRFLRAELAGYEAYAAQVRWRLLPGVW